MLSIKQLEKSYGKQQVLKDINLDFKAGSITGLIGPNGSGKSTLLKSILGLVKPDDGKILIDDQQFNDNQWQLRKHLGYMPQYANFPENLTCRQVIHFVKNLRQDVTDYDEDLHDRFKFNGELDKKTSELSGGNRQKLSAIITCLFNADVLILDEPTAGLDPISSQQLKEKLIIEKEKGKTIIVTSHIISEIEQIADQLVFLLNTSVKLDQDIISLKQANRGKSLQEIIVNIIEADQ